MITLDLRHTTTYRYANPVRFLEHRLISRPRSSHELSLLDTGLSISPPAQLRWLQDVFGNSVARLAFDEASDTLVVESSFRAEHYPGDPQLLVLDDYAATLPFSYNEADALDLAPYLRCHYEDPEGLVADWMQGFIEANGAVTLDVLNAMVQTVQRDFGYQRRDEHGTWIPTTTLANQAGSCRDYALLMMEALRSIGVATRFVSGYLYDEAAGNEAGVLLGGGETHAWCDVYLPGEGWVSYDPTNALVAGRNLIPVAFARDPSQVSPLSGGFDGLTGDFLGMEVNVTITRV
ncbi:MAG: transglutaminase family protein [Pseudomonadota bacterium]